MTYTLCVESFQHRELLAGIRFMRFGLVGCGLIGEKRAAAIRTLGYELTLVADSVAERAAILARNYGAEAARDWGVLASADVDAVVVATSNDWLSRIAVACLIGGKHVLVEKPAGRSLAEVKTVADAALSARRKVKVGYNHRFHPAIQRARKLFDEGEIGPPMFIRGRYGHGGRVGYEKEWRFNREKSGGGELLDQGSHLIDLAHWFLGAFDGVKAELGTFYWPGDVEDNCFLSLRATGGQVAWLHASWSEWKNMFSFEIYGKHGKLQIDGLGGSYGVETLSLFRMLPEMGPPDTTRWEWPFRDRSWEIEIAEFCNAISQDRRPVGDIHDAMLTMAVIDRAYKEVRT
jgi:predicted dehydrogenase